MRRFQLILISVLLSTIGFGQYNEATRNYDLGNEYFQQKEYEKAIEFYSISLSLYRAADAYYNRALSFIQLHDTCNYCKDMKNAAGLNDHEAFTLYKKICCFATVNPSLPDSIKIQVPGATHFEILHDLFGKDSTTYVISEVDGSIEAIEISDVSDYHVFTVVEESPSFPGGADARAKFCSENLHYPPDAKKNNIQGTVFVNFIVERDGSISNVKVLRGIGGGCDEESIRLIKSMPRWIPGKQRGKPVRVRFNMPVRFTLAG
ncbi:MAG TPA: TonB family protein [Bacteroidales bacterium]|nr:TonB family protein [Bacteroidales bacterium]HPT15423.1 TonB family protein [Bacteroidales bacterium]